MSRLHWQPPRSVFATLLLLACAGNAPRIVDRPISFSEQRHEMTRAYITEHYGLRPGDISITPRMIVLHWTAIDDLAGSFRAFDRETLAGRPELASAGDVNVSIQFLVDRDGTIYRLMPETWMARHVIGLNYDAIGVENVGGANGVDNLTREQVAANVELVRYLRKRYPTIEYLIGHHEYQAFERHPLWRELDTGYRTVKIDPGERFMAAVRAGVAELRLKGAPAVTAQRPRVPKPAVLPHSVWEAQPPVGHAADATRRNLAPGDTLKFHDLAVVLHEMTAASNGAHTAVLELQARGSSERRTVRGGVAFNWSGFHIAVLAVNAAPGVLGAGLVELEAATVASLSPQIAAATIAGDATYRLRIAHDIQTITLHHTGSAEPLRPADDPKAKLRGLQTWGQAERNWWDVPYHFLIDLDGNIYEGRDYRYMGETNTRYNPRGHFLISVIGNYELQQPTAAQITAITDMMTWAAAEFNVPPERIYGHGELTTTACPGKFLRALLDDGTFRGAVAARLKRGP